MMFFCNLFDQFVVLLLRIVFSKSAEVPAHDTAGLPMSFLHLNETINAKLGSCGYF